jgi:DtxR family Mn-dependent transcriptional regulator
LTPEGERLAVEVIRAHRLWERYLADEAGMNLQDIHTEAERREHMRQRQSVDALDAALGYPAHDPHGDPIPTTDGQILPSPGHPITDWPLHTAAQIVHLEDEPPDVFRQLLGMGLALGQVVHVDERDSQVIVFSDERHSYRLAPRAAANVYVAPPTAAAARVKGMTLDALDVGQSAVVLDLDSALQGFIRRRLLDLGLTPGVSVTAEMRSLFGDPTAYRVRGALIALRRDQACKVHVVGDAAPAAAQGDRP